jgi:tetratricopeptide (TPR) repeat protein
MWNEAESFYTKALALKPDYTKAILNLGHLYYMTARYDLAAGNYRKVLFYEPDNLQAKNNLTAILSMRKAVDEK